MAKPQPTNDKLPHELFELLEKTAEKDRPELLEKYGNTFGTKTILQLNFSDSIVLGVPVGPPPYRENDSPAGLEASRIRRTLSPLGRLLKSNASLPPYKKESMFVTMLESLHAKDALILIAAKDGELESLYPSVTEKLVRNVWPDLILA